MTQEDELEEEEDDYESEKRLASLHTNQLTLFPFFFLRKKLPLI